VNLGTGSVSHLLSATYTGQLTRMYWHSVEPTLRQLEQARPLLRSPLHLIFLFRHRVHLCSVRNQEFLVEEKPHCDQGSLSLLSGLLFSFDIAFLFNHAS
jgi:hypothetical protein